MQPLSSRISGQAVIMTGRRMAGWRMTGRQRRNQPALSPMQTGNLFPSLQHFAMKAPAATAADEA